MDRSPSRTSGLRVVAMCSTPCGDNGQITPGRPVSDVPMVVLNALRRQWTDHVGLAVDQVQVEGVLNALRRQWTDHAGAATLAYQPEECSTPCGDNGQI